MNKNESNHSTLKELKQPIRSDTLSWVLRVGALHRLMAGPFNLSIASEDTARRGAGLHNDNAFNVNNNKTTSGFFVCHNIPHLWRTSPALSSIRTPGSEVSGRHACLPIACLNQTAFFELKAVPV